MLHRLVEQLGDLVLLACMSLLFGIVKVIAAPTPDCWKCNFGSLFISVIIGTLAGALALQTQLGDYTALAISSFCSLISRDLVMAILDNRKNIGGLLKRAAENLVDRFTK